MTWPGQYGLLRSFRLISSTSFCSLLTEIFNSEFLFSNDSLSSCISRHLKYFCCIHFVSNTDDRKVDETHLVFCRSLYLAAAILFCCRFLLKTIVSPGSCLILSAVFRTISTRSEIGIDCSSPFSSLKNTFYYTLDENSPYSTLFTFSSS